MHSFLYKVNNNKSFKMKNIVIYLLLFLTAASQSFFLDSKDFRKLLQLFPKPFETDNSKVRQTHLRRRDNDQRYREHHSYDYHDRRDKEESSRGKIRNLKKYNNINEKLHDSHVNCDHPDHYHHHLGDHHDISKYSRDRSEKNYHKHKDEMKDYHEKKHLHDTHVQSDKDLDDKFYEKNTQDKQSNPKKDYITGVIVAIPKFKNEDDLEGFYKSKQQAFLLQQLLKANDDEIGKAQEVPEDEDKSYLY